MNKDRIAELRIQAMNIILNDTTLEGIDEDSGMWEKAWDEVFAELVIRECAEIACEETLDDNVGYMILQHFGMGWNN